MSELESVEIEGALQWAESVLFQSIGERGQNQLGLYSVTRCCKSANELYNTALTVSFCILNDVFKRYGPLVEAKVGRGPSGALQILVRE